MADTEAVRRAAELKKKLEDPDVEAARDGARKCGAADVILRLKNLVDAKAKKNYAAVAIDTLRDFIREEQAKI